MRKIKGVQKRFVKRKDKKQISSYCIEKIKTGLEE